MGIETELTLQAAKMLTYFGISFIVAMWLSPVVIRTLTRLKFWKKNARTHDTSGNELTVTKAFYEENEGGKQVPRAGGVLIWGTTLIIAVVFFLILKIYPDNSTDTSIVEFLNFTDSTQTFIPLGVMMASALLGLTDDILVVLPNGGNYFAGGLKLSYRLAGVAAISGFIGWWFHAKIGDVMHKIQLPWWNNSTGTWYELNLENINLPLNWLDTFTANTMGFDWNLANGGWLIIPITFIVLLAVWGSSIIDGFDGIAAGSLIPIYLCFAGVAFVLQMYDIATFLAVVTGAMVAYLWFNIPPARFIMGDTGSLSLTLTLGTVAMLMNKLYILPIAGLVLLLTVGSAFLQVLSKKVFKKKLFLAAPLHHHLEASGWKREQVTMRYWLISTICSVLGFALGLIITSGLQ